MVTPLHKHLKGLGTVPGWRNGQMKYTNQIVDELGNKDIDVGKRISCIIVCSQWLADQICAENADMYIIGELEVRTDSSLGKYGWYWTFYPEVHYVM